MNDLVRWVKRIEDSAAVFYRKAAQVFDRDEGLSRLLRELSEDEERHSEIVSGIAGLEGAPPSAVLSIGDEVKREIEDLLSLCLARLESGDLNEKELLDSIIEIEYSETNGIFLYLLSALKEDSTAADEIRSHRRRIERFLRSRAEFPDLAARLAEIPEVFRKRILVVDDEKAMLSAFEIFLTDDAAVDSAANGLEALGKVDGNAHRAIITDIDMPVMNGMEFYLRAVEKYPSLKGRFIFLTGSIDRERLSFLEKNNLRYFVKPVPLKEIKKAVLDMIRAGGGA